jgi:hypothetical protein
VRIVCHRRKVPLLAAIPSLQPWRGRVAPKSLLRDQA